MNDETLILNNRHFRKMACGDLGGFIALAGEFFEDTRARVAQWPELLLLGDEKPLLEEFHRCKGGAALFGFEGLVHLLDDWERDGIKGRGIDLDRFLAEMNAAESAVAVLLR